MRAGEEIERPQAITQPRFRWRIERSRPSAGRFQGGDAFRETTAVAGKTAKRFGARHQQRDAVRRQGQLPGGQDIAKLAPDERLAVEMWMNEDVERTWLAGELTLLEREWQEAERLAKIADGLVFEAEGVAPSPSDSVIPSEGA